jgi:hypothetical protein
MPNSLCQPFNDWKWIIESQKGKNQLLVFLEKNFKTWDSILVVFQIIWKDENVFVVYERICRILS